MPLAYLGLDRDQAASAKALAIAGRGVYITFEAATAHSKAFII